VGPGARLHRQHASHSRKNVSLPLSSHEVQCENQFASGAAFQQQLHKRYIYLVAVTKYSAISAISMMQCVADDGKSEHRVCIFKNIVLWEGQLLYVANGELAFVFICKPCVSFTNSGQG